MKLLHCGIACFSSTKSWGSAPSGTSLRVSHMLAFETTDLVLGSGSGDAGCDEIKKSV